MKAVNPSGQLSLWRSEQLYNIDFGFYSLQRHHFDRHFHDHFVIEFVVQGADEFYCDGKTYTATEKQLVLINPGEIHTGNSVHDVPLKYFSLYPDRQSLEQVAASVDINLPSDFMFPRTVLKKPEVTEEFERLFHSFQANEPMQKQYELFLSTMFSLLTTSVSFSKKNAGMPRRDPRIESVKEFIRAHFKEEITLNQLAELVRLNPFHLLRSFKKITGITPHDYIINLRTDQARKLLRTGCSVEQAAIRSGFYDSSHLNRSVRKIAATSPKSFLSSKCQFHTKIID